MFVLQEKVNGKFKNVLGKFQYGEVGHAKRRAQKDYGGKLNWKTEVPYWNAYDYKDKHWYRIKVMLNNPAMLSGDMGLHVIEPKKGVFVYVGSIPFDVMDIKKATSDDVRGGRAFYGDDGKLYTRKSPIFKTRKAAVAFAKKKGYKIIPPGKRKKNPVKMKPETIKRRAAARKKSVKAQRKNLEKRLSEKAKQEGPNSIWAEMLDELRSKNPSNRYTVKQLSEIRKNFSTIKGIDPESQTYNDLIVLLDGMPQVQLKQLAAAKIKFLSGLARNRVKRSKNPVKKKRSAKQLANDKRLGRMAKARAKAKRGGRRKVKRKKNVVRRGFPKKVATAKRRAASMKRAKRPLKKSHLWIVFRCFGRDVQYATIKMGRGAHVGLTGMRSEAAIFKTKTQAVNIANYLGSRSTGRHMWGVVSENQTGLQIRNYCEKALAGN